MAANDGQFAEVFVESDQDTILLVSTSKDFVIARVVRPVPGLYHIMAGRFQLLACLAPHTSV